MPSTPAEPTWWRGVATRYDKRAVTYRATVTIAPLMLWLTS